MSIGTYKCGETTMERELSKNIAKEIGCGKSDPRFDVSFPVDGQTPETLDLANYNLTALREGKHQWDPQTPSTLNVSCSRIELDRVLGVRRPGEIFHVSGRAGRVSEGGMSSLEYGLGLKPALLQVLVHTCTREGICRSQDFRAKTDWGVSLPPISGITETPKLDGIEAIDFRHDGHIPDVDRLHSRNRVLKILAQAPQIKELIASGSLLVGESYYDEKSGKVFWMGFWRSTNSANQIPKGFLHAIVSGAINKDSHLEELHPSLKALNALVHGNRHFAHQFEPPVPTEVVAFGCADSRVSPIALKSPFGLIEWLRNAGNVFDSPMLPGLRDSLETAEQHLRIDFERNGPKYGDPEGFKRRVTLLVLSHTQCGAITAALDPATRTTGTSHGDVRPIVSPLRQRLAEYQVEHQNPKETDPHLAIAAQTNAIGACLDLVTSEHPDAKRIREMVLDNRVILVPARYSLRRGLIQMFKPLTSEHAHRVSGGHDGTEKVHSLPLRE